MAWARREAGSTHGASPTGAMHPLVASAHGGCLGRARVLGAHGAGLGSLASYWGVHRGPASPPMEKPFEELGFGFSRLRAHQGGLHHFPRGPRVSLLPLIYAGKSKHVDKMLEAGFPSAGINLPFSP